MNDRETRRYNCFGRIDSFGQDNSADSAPNGEGAKHLATLADIIGQLDQAKAGQQGGGATSKAVLLDALRLDIQNISRTAEVAVGKKGGW